MSANPNVSCDAEMTKAKRLYRSVFWTFGLLGASIVVGIVAIWVIANYNEPKWFDWLILPAIVLCCMPFLSLCFFTVTVERARAYLGHKVVGFEWSIGLLGFYIPVIPLALSIILLPYTILVAFLAIGELRRQIRGRPRPNRT